MRAVLAVPLSAVRVTVPELFLIKVNVASAISAMSIESEFAPVISPPGMERSSLVPKDKRLVPAS